MVRKENGTYLERSEFLAAYLDEEMIGFIKLIYVDGAASITILSKNAHYDKRPANALIARAVELCETRRKSHLIYCNYNYGKTNNSSLTEFKRRSGFEKLSVPRYYVPLTKRGALAVRLNLHRGVRELLPAGIVVPLLKLRAKYDARQQQTSKRNEEKLGSTTPVEFQLITSGIMGCVLRGPRNGAGVLEQMFEACRPESAASPWRYRNATIGRRRAVLERAPGRWHLVARRLFPDPAEINELRARGHKLAPVNGSYLPHLYEEAGPSFFERLNGRFSGVLADLRNETITVFNDRFGLGRIYFVENESGFYFSSAAKSLLRIFPETRQFDERGVAEFCACLALQNRTLYRGISVLPNAAKWTFSASGVVRKETYFTPSEWENQTTLDEEEYYDALQDTFAAVLPRYISTSQAIGMSLTGGLDGRMIMAWAKPKPGTLPCYTFGGTYRESTDVATARRVARACQQTHSNILIGPEFLDLFPRLAEEAILVSDGAIDVTGSVEIFANRKARRSRRSD